MISLAWCWRGRARGFALQRARLWSLLTFLETLVVQSCDSFVTGTNSREWAAPRYMSGRVYGLYIIGRFDSCWLSRSQPTGIGIPGVCAGRKSRAVSGNAGFHSSRTWSMQTLLLVYVRAFGHRVLVTLGNFVVLAVALNGAMARVRDRCKRFRDWHGVAQIEQPY